MRDKPPPSMRDFDYFAERRAIAPAASIEHGLPAGAEERQRSWRRRRRRSATAAITASLVVAMSAWFIWSYRDLLAYAFSPARPAQQLGDVVELAPADIPHNAYVELTGITEHRGLTQKLVRGLWPVREELWYFRLLGSRGVFVEVRPDARHYGFATRIRAIGRAVDPARSALHARLLAEYRERFHVDEGAARIIQVGVVPGEGRGPFFLMFALLGLVIAADVWSLLSYARIARRYDRELLRAP